MLHFAPKKIDRSRVVYGGVDTDIFRINPKAGDNLRKRLDLTEEHIVLCLGRVLPHKGIDIVIKALPLMPQNTRLLVVGQILNQEYFSYLTKLTSQNAKDKVTFLGQIPTEELPNYYNLCDVFIQPSLCIDYTGRHHRLSELLGLSKLEAMACGKPVVVSKVGGLPEKIIETKNGYTSEPGNEKELADHVTELLMDKKLRRKVGENASNMIASELTWSKVASNILDFYDFTISNQ